MQDIYYLLNNQEKQWLDLKLLGYKQYEIANMMHLSISTIKKIKKITQSKIMQHLQYNLERNDNMNQITTSQLLYIQTGIGPKSVTQCHYQQYDISLPITINHTLIYLLELHQKSLPLQKKLAKRLLQINKKIPLH